MKINLSLSRSIIEQTRRDFYSIASRQVVRHFGFCEPQTLLPVVHFEGARVFEKGFVEEELSAGKSLSFLAFQRISVFVKTGRGVAKNSHFLQCLRIEGSVGWGAQRPP